MADVYHLYEAALKQLPFEPTSLQDKLLRALCGFACHRQPKETFVIQG